MLASCLLLWASETERLGQIWRLLIRLTTCIPDAPRHGVRISRGDAAATVARPPMVQKAHAETEGGVQVLLRLGWRELRDRTLLRPGQVMVHGIQQPSRVLRRASVTLLRTPHVYAVAASGGENPERTLRTPRLYRAVVDDPRQKRIPLRHTCVAESAKIHPPILQILPVGWGRARKISSQRFEYKRGSARPRVWPETDQ